MSKNNDDSKDYIYLNKGDDIATQWEKVTKLQEKENPYQYAVGEKGVLSGIYTDLNL